MKYRRHVRSDARSILISACMLVAASLPSAVSETITIPSPPDGFLNYGEDIALASAVDVAECECDASTIASEDLSELETFQFEWSRYNFVTGRTNRVLSLSPDIIQYSRKHESDVKLTGHADRRRANLELTGKVRGEDARFSRLFGVNVVDKTSIWLKADVESTEWKERDFEESFVSLGVDYRLNKQTVVGIVGQYDMLDDRNSANWQFQEGWLVGPYLISHLTKTLILDARAAWGEAFGHLADEASSNGAFQTDRFMAVSQLSGNFTYDDWRLTPALSVSWFAEEPSEQDYSDAIPDYQGKVEVGRLSFGPSLSRKFFLFNQYEVEPTLHLKGAWDFDPGNTLDTSNGTPYTSDRLRARLEGVFTAQLSEKRRFIMDGFYDGVGVSGLNTYGLKIGMAVSLR